MHASPIPPAIEPCPPSTHGPALPPGHSVGLPGRGSIFFREVAGPPDAPVVMLLHGLGANADLNWHCAFAALGRHFRVIAPDHRGHGRGVRSDEPFRLEDCADDVVALADALGIDRFVAAGYSMGGPIAQLIWRRAPERVLGLVLCATSRDFRGHPRERLMFGGLGLMAGIPQVDRLSGVMRTSNRALLKLVTRDDTAAWAIEELERSDFTTVMQAAVEVGRFSSREWVHDIDVPTAVVVTKRDRLVPPHRQRKLAASIPGAVTFEVDGDHHVVARAGNHFVHALVGACRSVTPWPVVPSRDGRDLRRARRRLRRQVARLRAA